MFEEDDPYTLHIDVEPDEKFRERVINELIEFEKNGKKKELSLKANTKSQIAIIRHLATQRGLISRIKGLVSPIFVIINRFFSNVKCENLHEDEIKTYYEENKDKEDLNGANYIPMPLEVKEEVYQIKRDVENWKRRYNERVEKGLFSLPSSAKDLPINNYTEVIINGIKANRVFMISGETGCGKSTQVPQMILNDKELGPEACIICCQPRRLCAVGLAERVAEERGEKVGETVSYSIRFETKLNENTQLEYVTTGLLLRRLNNDGELKGISHLIIDEAHERDQFLDFLLVYVKDKLLKLNPNIHVIIMSATFQIEKFMNYFDAPHLSLEGRMFNVENIYLDDILMKRENFRVAPQTSEPKFTCSICHQVFYGYKLFGQHIVICYEKPTEDLNLELYKRIAHKEPNNNGDDDNNNKLKTDNSVIRQIMEKYYKMHQDLEVDFFLIIDIIKDIVLQSRVVQDAILIFLPGWKEIYTLSMLLKKENLLKGCDIHMLHSGISLPEQKTVFQRSYSKRKIILSTNIAETSITIDEVAYVIDSGLVKVNGFNANLGIGTLSLEYISKANAIQRQGRAGRTKPGKCYHLYTEQQFNSFNEYPTPEIQRISLEEVILQVRSLDRNCTFKVEDFLSKLMEPPNIDNINHGLEKLICLGALREEDEKLTKLGEYLSDIPINPTYGKLLILGILFHCFDAILHLVCIMSNGDIFMIPKTSQQKDKIKNFKRNMTNGIPNDYLLLLNVYNYCETLSPNERYRWCLSNEILPEKIEYARQLSQKYRNYLYSKKLFTEVAFINEYSKDINYVTAILCIGLYPQVAVEMNKKSGYLFNNKVKGVCHPASVIGLNKSNISYNKNCNMLIFNEVELSTDNIVNFKMNTYINPVILLLLCFSLDDNEKLISSEDIISHYQLNESLIFTVDTNYLKDILILKKKIQKAYCEFLTKPSSMYSSDKKSLINLVYNLFCNNVIKKQLKENGIIDNNSSEEEEEEENEVVEEEGISLPQQESNDPVNSFIALKQLEKSTQNNVVQPINIPHDIKNNNQNRRPNQYHQNRYETPILYDDSITYAVASDKNNKAHFKILKRNNKTQPSEYYKQPVQPPNINLHSSPIRASSKPPKDLNPSPIDLGENDVQFPPNAKVFSLAEIEKNLQNTSFQSPPSAPPPPPPPPSTTTTTKDSNSIPFTSPQVTPQKISTVNSAYVAGGKATSVVFVDKSSEKKTPNVKKGEITVQITNKKEKVVPKMMPISAIKKNLKK